ncbi:MAG: hypothetical protein WBX14_10245 [Candidatus Udaeobacter sp.]
MFARSGGVLQENRALEIVAAMQSGSQDKVAIEQRTSYPKKGEEIFAHLGSAGILPALHGMLPGSVKHAFFGKPPAECERQQAECSRS